ncbi:MAG: gamma-aminobutyraldehyde dehydrogenase [Actinomycetota bacterium]
MAHQWIAGHRVGPVDGGNVSHDVINPATGDIIEQVALAGPDDVNTAVAAAVDAQPNWGASTPADRSAVLFRWAVELARMTDEMARLETSQTGKPIRLSSEFDVPGTIDNVAFFAGAARTLEGRAAGEYSAQHTSIIRREPVGVIGAIAPWNYPLQMAAWKILPAIAAGNTIVLKPSELTPLTTLKFVEAAQRSGIPDGVINVVVGTGITVGERLVSHPDVAMVSFTGSSTVGQRVMELAARTTKRIHLELGGKAPFVVFDDADLDAAVHGAVAGALINTGQDCTAATRAIVHRSQVDSFVAGVADLMAHVKLGPPRDRTTDQGPLISFAHQQRVASHVDKARTEGAKVVCGGQIPGGSLSTGFYYEPTLITGVDPTFAIWRDEVFGPVLVVVPFDTDDEAIALANDTAYGLAASAWTTNIVRAAKASREIQAGCVWINDHIPILSEMPHGGTKSSGFGKDMSVYSFEEYTTVKHVMTDITGRARKPWHRTVFTRPIP